MKKSQWFFKFMIFLATLSLVLVALAPVIYLLAPQVSVNPVEEAIGVSEEISEPVFEELETPE